jgi:hypothetical protein
MCRGYIEAYDCGLEKIKERLPCPAKSQHFQNLCNYTEETIVAPRWGSNLRCKPCRAKRPYPKYRRQDGSSSGKKPRV